MGVVYDPDAPEGAKPRGSGYVTKRDIIAVAIAIPIIGALLYPFYQNMKADGEKTMCSNNLRAIGGAIQAYASVFDDRLPPIYEEGDNGSPTLIKGAPVTWMTVVERYLDPRKKTVCPSAKPEENSRYYSIQSDGPKYLSYGMFFPLSALPLYQISRPDDVVLLTETATFGANNTYNPVPLEYSDGSKLKDDGFIIGFDNKPDGNFEHAKDTTAVTRLAFANTSDGSFLKPGITARHKGGNHVIFASTRGGTLGPDAAIVKMLGEDVQGRWRTK